MTTGDDGSSPADDVLVMAQGVLDSQPFSRLIRASIIALNVEHAVLVIDIRDELRQQFGFVHGGVVAYAADNAITFASGIALGPSIVTSGMSIEYVRPASTGRIEARASVITATRRRAVCRCEVVNVADDGSETLCATAQGTATLLAPDRSRTDS